MDNILATKPKNVIIMTDSDMFCQGDQYITIKVPGVVW